MHLLSTFAPYIFVPALHEYCHIHIAPIETIEIDGTVLNTAIVAGIVVFIAVGTMLVCLLLLCVRKRCGLFR